MDGFDTRKRLSNHVLKAHKQFVKIEDYVIKHDYANVRPVCSACQAPVRYVSIKTGFKKYCFDCGSKQGGQIGGRIKETWNKGKTKKNDHRLAAQALSVTGAGNHFFGKHHSAETLAKISKIKTLVFEDVINRLPETVKMLSVAADYKDEYSQLQLSCKACGFAWHTTGQNMRRYQAVCKRCNPVSLPQAQIETYVSSLGFNCTVNDRTLIAPLELDVVIQEKNVAIEYHGLYWHAGGKSGVLQKNKHQLKHEQCIQKGIKLLQFFADEWRDKQDICKSMIKNALGCADTKFGARECSIVEVSVKDAEQFLDDNHIAGSTPSRYRFGLVHPVHGLVMVASLRIPRQKSKWNGYFELARLATKQCCSVAGGASKLIKHCTSCVKSRGYKGFLSYADLRFGTGKVYLQCGLKLVGKTAISYWYTDCVNRYDRFKYRAHNGKTEAQIAAEGNVGPIYGCASNIYVI